MLSERPRLAISLAVATLVPIVALVWLGQRVLQQDQDISRQRRRERLEVAGTRLALELERRFEDIEEQLARGPAIRLTDGGIEARGPDRPILFQPRSFPEPAVSEPGIAEAEIEEFQRGDLKAAAATYRRLAAASSPEVRAMALVALARVQRRQMLTDEALKTYTELERLGDSIVGGQPAALVALQGRCKISDETHNDTALAAASADLARALNSGIWKVDRPTFEMYRAMLDGWHAAATPVDWLSLTEAANRLWSEWRANELPSRGRRSIPSTTSETLAIWSTDDSGPRLWMATAGELQRLVENYAPGGVGVSAFNADGGLIFGARTDQSGFSLTPAETRLPFVLSLSAGAADAPETSRRAFVLAGLFGALTLILVAAYVVYRLTARELDLARQQSDFVAAVSHEFRTPLTSMRHLTDLLVTRGSSTEERRAYYYALLSNETERLYRMVEALLSFSRLEARGYAFQMEELDVRELVTHVVNQFRREAEAATRTVHCEIDEALPTLHGDREMLCRALWNLIENAAKYSEVSAPIRVFARLDRNSVLVGVTDHGCGIPVSERRLIFQKFGRGAASKRERIRGVGIGLSLVKRIADAHGAAIHLESEVGKGSTFTLIFPLASAVSLGGTVLNSTTEMSA